MRKRFLQVIGLYLACCVAGAAAEIGPVLSTGATIEAKKTRVVVIKVHEQINSAILYIIRRGVKEAIAEKADAVVFDLKTPGGALDSTLQIMEVIAQFPGLTVAYVNNEAMSAGAFISAVTGEIWFTPDGIIGAAAPVGASGAEVEKTMRLKVVSYLKARMRATSEGMGYRGQVISAMIDEDVELKLDDKVLKQKGELLTLTAAEASRVYGTPPQPLLAAGIAKNLEELLGKKFGAQGFTVRHLETTWSENLAVLLNRVSPLLLGLGMLALFIEFKTPGFGIFGISGITLLAIVFLGNFVAGLSGHEPMLVFAAGLLLIVAELFFFPGSFVLALAGLVLMLGSLVWSMADIWPNRPIVLSGDLLARPFQQLLIAFLIGGGVLALIYRFLPHGWIWNRLAVGGAVLGAGMPVEVLAEKNALVGRDGMAVTNLFPAGQVEIDGKRYEARLEVGFADPGTPVRVLRRTDFDLVVEIKKT
ncbi:MAG: NfeD family protein [Opitutaceae bacterium]